MNDYDVTVHFNVKATSYEAAEALVANQLDQTDLMFGLIQITDVEELAGTFDPDKHTIRCTPEQCDCG